ncbi:GyrI-like domain-containing protein [Paenibacillus sp. NPDC058071]|uniref:GyrI-like domain-containing protein n=1 Tax=Paenibacillus sp. NPDC058071 TaxID=3346326 RepID=UPI0036DC06F8
MAKGTRVMEAKTVWKESIQVVGEKVRYDPSAPVKPSQNVVARLWDRFNERAGEVEYAVGGGYGASVCREGDSPDGPIDYVAAVKVSRPGLVPDGMERLTLPGGLYCVVTRQGVIDDIGEAYRFFWEEWLPESGYVPRDGGISFEFYDRRYKGNNVSSSIMDIWFPIQPASPSPIVNRTVSAFVHVADLRRSAEWYSRLLGLPLKEERLNNGPVYWLELEGAHLVLDSNANNRNNPQWREEMKPRCMLPATDIDEAYRRVAERAEVFFEPERYESLAFFSFRDPDGNAVMVCWNKGEDEETLTGLSPIKRIGGIFLDVKHTKVAAEWYSHLFELPYEEQSAEQPLYSIPVESGAAILLDANRYLKGESFTELFYFETDDFDQALEHIRDNGFQLAAEPQRFDDLSEVALLDPDGNRIVVACVHSD